MAIGDGWPRVAPLQYAVNGTRQRQLQWKWSRCYCRLLKCGSLYNCAAADKISAETAHHAVPVWQRCFLYLNKQNAGSTIHPCSQSHSIITKYDKTLSLYDMQIVPFTKKCIYYQHNTNQHYTTRYLTLPKIYGDFWRAPKTGANAAVHSSRELVFTSSRPVKTRSIHVVSS